MTMCENCGWYKENGGYALVWPSDCHDKGGHYTTHFDGKGKFIRSDAPWQIHPDQANLSRAALKRVVADTDRKL